MQSINGLFSASAIIKLNWQAILTHSYQLNGGDVRSYDSDHFKNTLQHYNDVLLKSANRLPQYSMLNRVFLDLSLPSQTTLAMTERNEPKQSVSLPNNIVRLPQNLMIRVI